MPSQGIAARNEPDEGQFGIGLACTVEGCVRIGFTHPVTYVDLTFHEAQSLAKNLKKMTKQLLKDGFAVQNRKPSGQFPFGRFDFDAADLEEGENL